MKENRGFPKGLQSFLMENKLFLCFFKVFDGKACVSLGLNKFLLQRSP